MLAHRAILKRRSVYETHHPAVSWQGSSPTAYRKDLPWPRLSFLLGPQGPKTSTRRGLREIPSPFQPSCGGLTLIGKGVDL